MPQRNPADVANKWASRTAAAGPDYAAGIAATTVNPMELAANAKDKWLANIQQAAARGDYENGLRAVSAQTWKDKSIKKGAPRIVEGVNQAKPRMTQFLTGFLPAQEQVTTGVKAMPSVTFEDRVARATAQMRGTHELKGRF